MVRTAVALMLLFTTLIVPAPASAADTPVTDAATAAVSAVVPGDVGLIQKPIAQMPIAPVATARRSERSLILPSLYVSLAALQAFDAYTTFKGLDRGATEGNPLMQDVTRHPAAFVALKAGVTGVSIYAAERLWRQNRKKSAIIMMLASNGLMAWVASHNAAVIRGLR
jgi:hypothetical protein